MKIIQITGAYVGAQKKIAKQLHQGIIHEGWSSEILFGFGSIESSYEHTYETKTLIFLRRIFYKFLNKNCHSAFFSTLKLIKIIDRKKPDIVHLHIIHHGYLDFEILFKYFVKKKIPVVFTVHDMWPFTGGCYYFTDIKCEKFINNCTNCPKDLSLLDCQKKKTLLMQKKKKLAYKQLKKIVFVGVSEWVTQELNKSFLQEYHNRTIFNSVDNCIRQYEPCDGNFRIIGVANQWTKRKGIDRFLTLASMLPQGFEIILIGNVESEIIKNSPNNITFLGPIKDAEELAKIYSNSHIHISMSYEETFGMTFIEAAISGIKSIGFNSSAVPSILARTYGYIVDVGDIIGMVNLLKKLNTHRSDCYLNHSQQIEVTNVFSSEKMIKDYLSVYREVLE